MGRDVGHSMLERGIYNLEWCETGHEFFHVLFSALLRIAPSPLLPVPPMPHATD